MLICVISAGGLWMLELRNLKCEEKEKNLAVQERHPCFSWTYSEVDDLSTLLGYVEVLDNSNKMVWRSNPQDASFKICYDGEPLTPCSRYLWRVTVFDNLDMKVSSEWSFFDTALWGKDNWKADWIHLDNHYIEHTEVTSYYTGYTSPYFIKEFQVDVKPRRAILYMSACGIYEFLLNGEKTEPVYYSPGWTDYSKRIQYQAYDLSDILHIGENILTISLGDGWYRGYINNAYKLYGDVPLKLIGQILIENDQGEYNYICTDETWMAGIGPLRYSDLQLGEFYDACKEPIDWSIKDPEFFRFPVIAEENDELKNRLTPQEDEYILAVEEIPAVSMNETETGRFVFDIGQNISGFVRLCFSNSQYGQEIQLLYGERLNADGTVYINNLRTARQSDIYISKGTPHECYTPHFTSHGFQYVEISGLSTEQIALNSVTGIFISTNCSPTGHFTTSHDGVNTLYNNIVRSQRGNFSTVPTDCPQRDERLGWTGDAQVFCKSACYNMSCNKYYGKYLTDMLDAQHMNGSYSDIAPMGSILENILGEGNAAWGDAGVIIPWTLYLFYANIEILAKNYNSMYRHAAYLVEISPEYIGKNTGYGDWLNVDDFTPLEVMTTAYSFYVCTLMTKISNVLGKEVEGGQWRDHAEKFKNAFCQRFVEEDGRISGDSQTVYLLALKFKIVDSSMEQKVFSHLLRRIEETGFHLTTGFVGVSYLLPVLSEYGRNDLAYRLLKTETYPSWLYSLNNGATSIWERWNSHTLDSGFGCEEMNSFNHYSLGSVCEWFFSHCCGIQPDETIPGFKRFHIRPYPDPGLSFARAEYQSVSGKIYSRWDKKDAGYVLKVHVPPNTEGIIWLPLFYSKQQMSVGIALAYQEENGWGKYTVKGGKYEIYFAVEQ